MPTPYDHTIAALLILVWPVVAAINGRRDMRALDDDPPGRLRMYGRTIAVQWLHVVAIVLVWNGAGRPWVELGLGLTIDVGFGAALVVAAALGYLLWRQLRGVRADPVMAARVRDQVAEMRGFLPASDAEVRAFRAMALTAGICEEIVCRGFLLWYLGAYMHPAPAVVVMAVAFGCTHLYQGAQAAAQIAGLAVVAALLYHLSGSLWIPMALHIAMDLAQHAVVRSAVDAQEGQPLQGAAASNFTSASAEPFD